MSTAKELAAPAKGTATLVRPRFSPGLLLQDSDLNTAVDYGRSLTQILFRNLFGCGVICGFEVTATVDKCNVMQVTVARGLALDCQGNPIEVCTNVTVKITGDCAPGLPPEIWVMIRRCEKNSAPRGVSCDSEDDTLSTVCTRICDGYEIRLVAEPPECVCGCVHERPKPQPTACCTDQDPTGTPGAIALSDEQIQQRREQWEKSSDEERARRRQEMHENARRCDRDHRHGVCNCGTCCEWVLLARLYPSKQGVPTGEWIADHTVRRFIRPVLSEDFMAHRVKE